MILFTRDAFLVVCQASIRAEKLHMSSPFPPIASKIPEPYRGLYALIYTNFNHIQIL
jgi:hypothetical protein